MAAIRNGRERGNETTCWFPGAAADDGRGRHDVPIHIAAIVVAKWMETLAEADGGHMPAKSNNQHGNMVVVVACQDWWRVAFQVNWRDW